MAHNPEGPAPTGAGSSRSGPGASTAVPGDDGRTGEAADGADDGRAGSELRRGRGRGGGGGGERRGRAGRTGLSVALVEHALVGGECSVLGVHARPRRCCDPVPSCRPRVRCRGRRDRLRRAWQRHVATRDDVTATGTTGRRSTGRKASAYRAPRSRAIHGAASLVSRVPTGRSASPRGMPSSSRRVRSR